jgi:hypothetical protein
MEDFNFAKAREAWATPVKMVAYNCLCGRTMKFESEHGVIEPQRKPLTDEQIMAICRELGLKCKLGGNPNIDFDYARAIEAAHGIKE